MYCGDDSSKVAVLVVGQRRFAHLRRIVLKNLVPKCCDLPVKGAFFRLHAEDGSLLYESECASDGCNPEWLPISAKTAYEHPHSAAKRFILRVYSVPVCPTGPDHEACCELCRGACKPARAASCLAFEQMIDLGKLMHLNLNFNDVVLTNLPLNTMLLQLCDGFYGFQPVWLDFRKRNLIPVAKADREAPAVLTVSSCFVEIRKIIDTQGQLTRIAHDRERAAAIVADKLVEHKETLAKSRAIAAKKQRIAELKRRLAATRQAVTTERARIKERKQGLTASAKALKAVMQTAKPASEVHAKQQSELATERSQYQMARHLLTARQLCLVSDVRSVYPIHTDSEIPRIRGVDLDLASADDIQLSTALGHVAHLVVLLAKYLEIPLCYAIRNMGSRSTIKNSMASEQEYPLYFKGVERARFEAAVELLKFNILRLLSATGLGGAEVQRDGMLQNLERLFHHLLRPIDAFEPRRGHRSRSKTMA